MSNVVKYTDTEGNGHSAFDKVIKCVFSMLNVAGGGGRPPDGRPINVYTTAEGRMAEG